MSWNLKVLIVIEGLLAISFIRDLIGNPLVVLLAITSFVLMFIGSKSSNYQLGKLALYLCLAAIIIGVFSSGVFISMLIVVIIWWFIFGLDELKHVIQQKL